MVVGVEMMEGFQLRNLEGVTEEKNPRESESDVTVIINNSSLVH